MNGKIVIDVSRHNGSIDWKKVKEAEVYGVIVRCGFGNNTPKQDDEQFKANMDGALKAGLKVGVYIYSYASNTVEAISEAEHTIRLVSKYKSKLSYPIYYDVEEVQTQERAKEIIKVFNSTMVKAGYKNKIGVYANEYWWTTFLKGLECDNKWIAKYGINNGKMNQKPSIKCDMWQYTDKGSIDGVKGNVDVSIDMVDIPNKNKKQQSTKKKDNNTIAKEVITGKWGNGDERKNKLEKAGYNYKTVQSIVNKLMRGK